MAINFGLLSNALPNFSNESILQSAMSANNNTTNLIGQALQAKQAGDALMSQRTLEERAQGLQQQQATAAQQAQASQQQQQANQFQAQNSIAQRAQNLQEQQFGMQKQAQENALQQQQLAQAKAAEFAKAYAVGDMQSMYALDPKTAFDIQKQKDEAAKQEKTSSQDLAKQEQQLRKEFIAQTGTSQNLAESYNKIQSVKDTLNNPDIQDKGAADTALIYAMAKMYDPGGRVTDGDYNTIAASTSIPTWLKLQANKLENNERMTPEQRANLLSVADGIYGAQRETYQPVYEQYRRIAQNQGMNVDDAVPDFFNMVSPNTKKQKAIQGVSAIQKRIAELEAKARQ